MTTKRLIRISYFTLLTVIGGMIRIHAGPVAFTLQTLFVILSGLVLGGRDGMFSQVAYMIIGLVGLPVFTGGGGFSYVFRPSFGYIVGFSVGAFVTGFIFSGFRTLSTLKIWLAGIAGLLPLYLIGMGYQVMILVTVNGLTIVAAFATLVAILVFFAIDIALLFLVALIYPRLNSMLKLRGTTPTPPADGGVASDMRLNITSTSDNAARRKSSTEKPL